MHFVYPIITFHILHFLIQNTCLCEYEQKHETSVESVEKVENSFRDNKNSIENDTKNEKFLKKLLERNKRAIVNPKLGKDGFTYYNIGVLMASRLDSPFDLERCGPAVDLGIQKINEKFLKHHKIKLNKVQER